MSSILLLLGAWAEQGVGRGEMSESAWAGPQLLREHHLCSLEDASLTSPGLLGFPALTC